MIGGRRSGYLPAMTARNVSTAFLFDIDGTLVDSNYLHVQAWSQAFDSAGRPVDSWRIHRAIGMDSTKLLEALLGDDADDLGDRAKKAHTEIYQRLTPRLRPFAAARELLGRLDERGVAVVLATSAPEDELKALLRVLDAEQWLTAVTSAEDAETAKPAPDLIHAALDKAGVTADHALLIGDTVWDGKACANADLRFVGVRSGGVSEAELRDAGAVAVYVDPADVLAHLDDPVFAEMLAGTASGPLPAHRRPCQAARARIP